MNQSPIASGSQMPPQPHETEKRSIGPIAGAIIVIFLLIAGGLYFWGAQLNQQSAPPPYIPSNDTSDADAAAAAETNTSIGLPAQSSSDDAAAIESDFRAMDMNAIDSQNETQLNSM